MTNKPIENWNTLLFVPAHDERLLLSCQSKSADAVVLDLEDSVPEVSKGAAREAYQQNLEVLIEAGCNVCVRINGGLHSPAIDLDAVVLNGTRCIVVPKASSANHLGLIDRAILDLERERGIVEGSISMIASIESYAVLLDAPSWKGCSERLVGLLFGTEDFCLDVKMLPTAENLFYPAQQLAMTAKLLEVMAFGFPASIADYSDEDELEKAITKGKNLGFDGVFCVHPKQLDVANRVYQNTLNDIESATEIVAAYDAAIHQGKGAVELRGKMIDLPVYQKAKRLLVDT